MASSFAAAPSVKINVAGNDIPDAHFLSYSVDRDMFQPCMAQIVLSNQGDTYSTAKVGDAVEIKVGDSQTSIYKGEIVGVEPTYKGGEKSRILLRCMNKFHRMLRKRQSVTYTDKTDQDILNQVVSAHGLTLDWKHETTITYKHVYQHNQSDMEFLRARAARMGCHVWCDDTTLHVKQPDLSSDTGIELKVDQSSPDATLRHFAPRVNSSAIVKKVTVKGWNPETKELITGEGNAQSSPLGSTNAASASGDFGNEETFTVDHPIWSAEEANAIAKAKLQDSSLSYMTGEAEVSGDPKFQLGTVVKITANGNSGSDPFNGKYYVMGLTHRHTAPRAREGGYVTILRLARDAQGG
jgi:phage protein D